jgi:hypothetical protein
MSARQRRQIVQALKPLVARSVNLLTPRSPLWGDSHQGTVSLFPTNLPTTLLTPAPGYAVRAMSDQNTGEVRGRRALGAHWACAEE